MTDRAESRTEPAPRFEVRFSVIVPTYDRPAHIAACIAALRRIERPGGTIEIVIVNDGGSALPTGTPTTATGCVVRVIEQANAGPATARNTGAMMARGELLAFTDDDCRPEPGWLTAFDAALRAQPDALAGGRTLNAIDSLFAEASQLLADFVGGVLRRRRQRTLLHVEQPRRLARAVPRGGRVRHELSVQRGRGSRAVRPLVGAGAALGARGGRRHPARAHAHRAALPAPAFTYGRGGAAFRRKRASTDRPVTVRTGLLREVARARVAPLAGCARRVYVALTMLAHASYAGRIALGVAPPPAPF